MPKPTLRRRAALAVLAAVAALLFAACAVEALTPYAVTPTPTRSAPATVAPEHAGAGICGRTPQVRQAILWRIEGVDHCASVTDAHLAGIGGTLDLSWWNIDRLQPGDLDGLSAVTHLSLNNNELTALEAGVFDGLVSLTRLDLWGNGLTSLQPELFEDLGFAHHAEPGTVRGHTVR